MSFLRKLTAAFFLLQAAVIPAEGAPKILQILHTNDLHSFWEKASNRQRGGYARIKYVMDEMEAEGRANGWTTIRLDGGDFSEGAIDFWANQGATSFEIIKLMGFDVVALGNHDHQLGLAELIRHGSQPETDLPLVAANFFSPHQPVNIKPGRMIYRDGFVIAVGGATTDNPTFTWTAHPAQITPPREPLEAWLAPVQADIRIALTHLGTKEDQKLVKKSSTIDVVIGGHSHSALAHPVYEKNKNGKLVPIVQAGARGMYVGRMLLELPLQQSVLVISYSLKKITHDIPEDPVIKQKVEQGLAALQNTFNYYDLNQEVGHADQNYFTKREPVPAIGNFLADSLREAAGAEIAFDSGLLYGERLAVGPVTLYDILDLVPHLYNWPSQGWQIMTCNVQGSRLTKALSIAAWIRQPMFVSGMTFRMDFMNVVKDIMINGQPLEKDRFYKFALSEGFVAGIQSYPQLNHICGEYTMTGLLVRDALVKKALAMGSFTEETFGPRRITGLDPSDWDCSEDCPE